MDKTPDSFYLEFKKLVDLISIWDAKIKTPEEKAIFNSF